MPPESLEFLIDELGFDIWSFGCTLIDIFSKEPIWQLEFTVEEIYKLHGMKLYPFIPSDITGLLKDIIERCLERDHEKRIKIDELMYILNIFFESSKYVFNIGDSKHMFNSSNNVNNINTPKVEGIYKLT
jgi:serine/threonine protein kinase